MRASSPPPPTRPSATRAMRKTAVAKSGRMPSNTRPPHPKVPNLRRKTSDMRNLQGLAEGPQYPSVFAQFSTPLKNRPDADGDGQKSPTAPTGREVRHGGLL